MHAWFAKILGRETAAKSDQRADVRRMLHKAMRNRSRMILEAPQGLVAAATIQLVSRDEMIVAQPFMSGMIYPLADGEWMKISFVEQQTNLTGQTMCIGRQKITGPRGPAYVYRLSLPEKLDFDDRRGQPRNDIRPEVAPDVRVEGGWLKEPLIGTLADISMTGLRIHASALTATIEAGQELTVQFLLPEPAGQIDEVIEVVRMEKDGPTGMHAICASFRRRLPRLEALLRMTTDRLPMPLEQAQRKIA